MIRVACLNEHCKCGRNIYFVLFCSSPNSGFLNVLLLTRIWACLFSVCIPKFIYLFKFIWKISLYNSSQFQECQSLMMALLLFLFICKLQFWRVLTGCCDLVRKQWIILNSISIKKLWLGSSSVPNVLHCENMKHFWTNWKRCLCEKNQNVNISILSHCFLRIGFGFCCQIKYIFAWVKNSWGSKCLIFVILNENIMSWEMCYCFCPSFHSEEGRTF